MSAHGKERAELRAVAKDMEAQETGPADAKPARVARGFIHTTHPETGLDVVFIPGEALPAWVGDLKEDE